MAWSRRYKARRRPLRASAQTPPRSGSGTSSPRTQRARAYESLSSLREFLQFLLGRAGGKGFLGKREGGAEGGGLAAGVEDHRGVHQCPIALASLHRVPQGLRDQLGLAIHAGRCQVLDPFERQVEVLGLKREGRDPVITQLDGLGR